MDSKTKKHINLSEQYPMVSEEEDKEIGETLDNIRKGDYVIIKNKKELKEYLLS